MVCAQFQKQKKLRLILLTFVVWISSSFKLAYLSLFICLCLPHLFLSTSECDILLTPDGLRQTDDWWDESQTWWKLIEPTANSFTDRSLPSWDRPPFVNIFWSMTCCKIFKHTYWFLNYNFRISTAEIAGLFFFCFFLMGKEQGEKYRYDVQIMNTSVKLGFPLSKNAFSHC